jgi:hypothetical protein
LKKVSSTPAQIPSKLLKGLISELQSRGVKILVSSNIITCATASKSFAFQVSSDKLQCSNSVSNCLPLDYLVTVPDKIAAIISNKLNANDRIFARKCTIQRISRESATEFMDKYHVLKSTQNAFAMGLFLKEELIAAATFSKGRKMNYLPKDKRSFELIRFCCKPGISIAGGLSKIVTHFCVWKNTGDIMTYVDKQFSDGSAFVKAGFKSIAETNKHSFLIDKVTFERRALKSNDTLDYDPKRFYLTTNEGNIKMRFSPTRGDL